MRRERVHEMLALVDSVQMRTGLRDGAVLALLAVGLEPGEVSRLHASAVKMYRGRLLVAVHRQGVVWQVQLPADLGGRVLAWLTERRLWSESVPVFAGYRGPLSPRSIYTILKRYRCQRKARRC